MPKENQLSDKPIHTVLVVDDEEGILKALRRLLSDSNIKVLTAPGGKEALKLLKDNRVSLIISDQRMPKMTGVEFLHRAREISPDTIRILLTGYADIDATIEAINSGAIRYYFNKPWDEEFFLSRINESLEMYRIASENKRLTKLTFQQNRKLKDLNQTLEQRVEDQTKRIKEQHKELQKSFMETIRAFSVIIGLRYKEIGSHLQRVASLSKLFLKHLNLSRKDYQDIVVAAFLHDIGKITVPANAENKIATSHFQSDREALAQHPILGQSCLCSISGFEEISLIVRHHHEDFDGGGYPDKLREKRIPLGARIIRIVDSYDHQAFIGECPNLKQLNDAAAHLVHHSGTKYDPDLVRKFIEHDIGKVFFQQEGSEAIVVKPADLSIGMRMAADVKTKSGLFVLPKGARLLSHGMVKRIVKIDKADPITDGIHVFKNNETPEEDHEQAQYITG
jgi:response regulator RpfG family c-di-GMP phosphodiesterase